MLTPRECKQLAATILGMRGPNLMGAGWCVDRVEVIRLLGLYTEPELTIEYDEKTGVLSMQNMSAKEPDHAKP